MEMTGFIDFTSIWLGTVSPLLT